MRVPFEPDHVTTAHILPVLLPIDSDRPGVMQRMREQNVQTSMHYPPIHRFDFYRRRYPDVELPNTERFCADELTIPLHPQLSRADIERVVDSLAVALAG